jgi:hypothetical protein
MMEVWSAETVVPRSLLEVFGVRVPEDCPSLVRVKVWIDCTGRCGVSYSTPAGHVWEQEGREAAERALENFFSPNRLSEWREIWRYCGWREGGGRAP